MADAFPAELAMNYGDETPAGMSEEDLEGIVTAEVMDAVSFIDSDIGKARADAIKYYRGDPLGNEEDGRSKFVSRDVADTIRSTLPSLMRVFFGPEHIVEFIPECEEDEPVAEQQTDYINHVVTKDNDGFEIIYAVTKNVLREKVGIVKYWWDDSVEVRTRRYTGLDIEGLTKLLDDVDESIDAEIIEKEEVQGPPDEQTGLPGVTFNITLKLKKKRDRARIEAVPPEEFLINRDAKSIDGARIVAHRRDMTVSDLIALGYEREFIEENRGQEDDLRSTDERLARNPWSDSTLAGGSADKSMQLVRYVEAYVTVDFDGDGIAELMKVCTIGGKIAHKESVDERPFADFHCDPEPHTFFGESQADQTMDIQLLKSTLIRAGLDSLASSIFPRIKVGPKANTDDVLNNEVGALIRTGDMADVEALTVPDVSPAALNWLGYADQVRENRTGMSKVSMGLDAEALQNTTATASEAQFTRSQERIELIARIMASGMRRLFRGLSGLVAANQRKERTVKLRNKWVQIDPRKWRVDMDVSPNVGLGGGTNQQKAQFLALVMSKQEAIFQQYGLQNPFVTVKQYLETVGRFVELTGFKNPQAFFNDSQTAEQMLAQMQAQPPAPDPKMVEVERKADLAEKEGAARAGQAERDAQRTHEIALRKLDGDMAIKREQVFAELDLKREQLTAELTLKAQEISAQIQLKQETAEAQVSDVQPGGDPG